MGSSAIWPIEFVNELHIAEGACIASMVELAPIFKLDYVTTCIASISAIFGTGCMDCMRHCDFDPIDIYRASLVYTHRMLNTFRLKPACQFYNGNACWLRCLCDVDGVTDMVKVTMRHQHQVNPVNPFKFVWSGRILLSPGINQYDLSLRSSELKGGMS